MQPLVARRGDERKFLPALILTVAEKASWPLAVGGGVMAAKPAAPSGE
jgi:hypothetical protein